MPLQCLVKDSKLILTEATKVYGVIQYTFKNTRIQVLEVFCYKVMFCILCLIQSVPLWLTSCCLCSQDSQDSTTPVWGRTRAWRCCISSAESCIKSCQEMQNHSGYQSNVSPMYHTAQSQIILCHWFALVAVACSRISWCIMFILIMLLSYGFLSPYGSAHRIDADT